VLGVVGPHWCPRQELGEPRLALLKRPQAPVLAVKLEQVEAIASLIARVRLVKCTFYFRSTNQF
jgi:hypothetical protein